MTIDLGPNPFRVFGFNDCKERVIAFLSCLVPESFSNPSELREYVLKEVQKWKH